MLTPQEVAEHGFSKARVGGYSMKEVDDFLDQLTEDYSALHKENAVLRGKINSLAKKINEYRETEDAMRSTLLSAQKMAKSMVDEAEEEKQRILSEAESEAVARKAELERQVTEEEGKLTLARANTQSFIDQIRALVDHERDFLDQLPSYQMSEPDQAQEPQQADAAEPEPAEPEGGQAASEEETDPESEPEPDAEPEPEPSAAASQPAAAEPEARQPAPEAQTTPPDGDVLASVSADDSGILDIEELDAGSIDFDNLKFGKDYEIH